MLKKFWILIFLTVLFSCNENSHREEEIEKVEVDFELKRFDREFAQATPENLKALQSNYPYLFPAQFPDSVWVEKLQDSIQQELNAEVYKAFPQMENEEAEFQSLFQHVKYYFPEFSVPDVITLTSEVDYKNKVIYTGDFLLVSLDTYLGADHKFYVGIQEFLKKNFTKNQIVVDAAEEISREFVPKPDSRTFLSHMLHYGKILYLKEQFLPSKSRAELMGYTEDELVWAESNEDQIWRYFIENEVLYDTDSQLYTRFLYPAPFSKFYLQLDAESPSRLGQYIGWRIVDAYMERNEVSIKQMLRTPAEEIFKNSNFKPKK
ncbi:gliding motility lipoprotein GldB [Christiangramia aquimixticola]|uniref:gliding motility lipoprotein GldB n=1 Tax=Christiangramia aquimixticola TaxID=1697558 RepID=UPI003AA94A1F